MHSIQPGIWRDILTGSDRLRMIVNDLTLLSFIDAEGHLNPTAKEAPNTGCVWDGSLTALRLED